MSLSFAALGLAALLSAAPAVPADDACPGQDFTSAELASAALVVELELDLDLGAGDVSQEPAARKPKCQPCPDRPWCPCTYEGRPRISCNPCCFRAWYDPYEICFD